MKSVYYGKSAQDLSLGTYRLGFVMGVGFGEGEGFRFIKMFKFLVFSAQSKQKHINNSTESVK